MEKVNIITVSSQLSTLSGFSTIDCELDSRQLHGIVASQAGAYSGNHRLVHRHLMLTADVEVEIEGSDKPALKAECIVMQMVK